MTWTNPDPWHCYQCGAEGLGGREAGDHHDRTAHAPKPKNPKPVGSVVPEGVNSCDVRAYGLENGWQLGNRGRLPQALIDQYVAAQQAKPRGINRDDLRELRDQGLHLEAIAQRLGTTVAAIEKAESRDRAKEWSA